MSDVDSLVNSLLAVEPRQTVTVSGHPESESVDDWHVNKAIEIGAGDGQTRAIVLQKADASEHWIVAILKSTANDWEFDTFAAFDGHPPKDLDASEHGEDLDPEAISVNIDT